MADSATTALGRKPRWRRRNGSFATADRWATVLVSRGVNGGRPSVRRRTNSLRGDDREYAKVADSVATARGSRPRWRQRNKSVAMAGRRAIVSHGTDGGGVTDGGGTASSIAAAANAAAAAIRGGGDCSGGGDTRRRRVQVGPPISSSLQGGGGNLDRGSLFLSLTRHGEITSKLYSHSQKWSARYSFLPPLYRREKERGLP